MKLVECLTRHFKGESERFVNAEYAQVLIAQSGKMDKHTAEKQ